LGKGRERGLVGYIPEKGDVIHLNFDPSLGHEQKGRRYAVVVSHYLFNKKTGMCYAVPISSKCKGYPTQRPVNVSGVKGCALIDQLKSIDYRARKVEFRAKLPEEQLEQILEVIEAIIFS